MGTTPEKNLQTLTFLLAEIGVIMIKAIHIVLRYAIHLYDLNHTGLWEHKGRYVYRRLLGCADSNTFFDRLFDIEKLHFIR